MLLIRWACRRARVYLEREPPRVHALFPGEDVEDVQLAVGVHREVRGADVLEVVSDPVRRLVGVRLLALHVCVLDGVHLAVREPVGRRVDGVLALPVEEWVAHEGGERGRHALQHGLAFRVARAGHAAVSSMRRGRML
eukprot:1699702-Rhodomonas_salina.1